MPRKQKKYHFIYKTTNLLTGRYYYGMHSTNNMDDGYLGSGKRLRRSINKYGKENHIREILEFCESRIELKKREEEIVNLNEIAKEDCMNLKIGGEGGWNNGTESQRKRGIKGNVKMKWLRENDIDWVSKRALKASNSMKLAYKEGIITASTPDWTGRKHSEETKKKIGEANSKSQKGSKNSQYGTCWIHNEKENRKIKKEELDFYLESGWTRGRKMKL